MELIANKSVEREIIDALEKDIDRFFYTLIPELHGRGKTKYRLGSATWPEMNFLLVSYLDDADTVKVKEIIREVKERFPKEGIKFFITAVTLL
jgi:hypothetical protein